MEVMAMRRSCFLNLMGGFGQATSRPHLQHLVKYSLGKGEFDQNRCYPEVNPRCF